MRWVSGPRYLQSIKSTSIQTKANAEKAGAIFTTSSRYADPTRSLSTAQDSSPEASSQDGPLVNETKPSTNSAPWEEHPELVGQPSHLSDSVALLQKVRMAPVGPFTPRSRLTLHWQGILHLVIMDLPE